MKRSTLISYGLSSAGIALFVIAIYMVFVYAPTERMMGDVQRIFYFHVPLAWSAFLAFFTVLVASILYLRRRQQKWDIIAVSAAEIGIMFTTLVLITGSIWARPTWGIWWNWEPRLTTALVLWFIYIAYMLVRGYASDREQRARYSAVVGIIGFLDVPIVFMSTSWWQLQHPGKLVFESGGLAPSMLATLMVSLAAFSVLYVVLLLQRISLQKSSQDLETLKEQME